MVDAILAVLIWKAWSMTARWKNCVISRKKTKLSWNWRVYQTNNEARTQQPPSEKVSKDKMKCINTTCAKCRQFDGIVMWSPLSKRSKRNFYHARHNDSLWKSHHSRDWGREIGNLMPTLNTYQEHISFTLISLFKSMPWFIESYK